MAGTVTITEQVHTSMKKVKFEWTSSTGGSADGTTTNSYSGLLYRAIISPSTGSAIPATNYDVEVNDSDGFDILNGFGENSSTNTDDIFGVSTTGACLTPITAVSSKLTLAVTDAGNAKTGEVILYIR